MRENTPPTSPYHGEEDDDDDLIYVGDNIDEVIEQLEEFPENEDMDEDVEGNFSIDDSFYEFT